MDREGVSLVIPGRNCADTIRDCLTAVVPMLEHTALREIIFVDDGSTDQTKSIVETFPSVTCLPGKGRGPGSARNIGWRAAREPLIWFVDSDCVAEPDALTRLLPHLVDSGTGAVGGSYGIMSEDSLLACLIHEEIVQRHLAMPARVDFLATFNVIYRRDALDQVGGFDERFLKGQDAELSWRVMNAGFELAFEIGSRVRHYHPVAWRSYMRTQRNQGYWRVWLHWTHRGHARGDDYSAWVDHMQPPLAMVSLLACAAGWWVASCWGMLPLLLLVLAQVPMSYSLLVRTRRLRYGAYMAMGFIRAFYRGVGMSWAIVTSPWRHQRNVEGAV